MSYDYITPKAYKVPAHVALNLRAQRMETLRKRKARWFKIRFKW